MTSSVVTAFPTAHADRLSEIRGLSLGARECFEEMLKDATSARRSLHSAKTAEKLIYGYARWLGRFHNVRNRLFTFIACLGRLRGDHSLCQRHRTALLHIAEEVSALELAAASPHPWLSLPHMERARHNADRLILEVITSCRCTILNLERLEGHEPGAAA